MPPKVFKVYMGPVMKEMKMGIGRMGVIFFKKGRAYRLPGLLLENDLALCCESEEDTRTMMERFIEVCRKKNQKVNADKMKVTVLGGEK